MFRENNKKITYKNSVCWQPFLDFERAVLESIFAAFAKHRFYRQISTFEVGKSRDD
jgi:hypothetical protein